jgi:hypothetical protein
VYKKLVIREYNHQSFLRLPWIIRSSDGTDSWFGAAAAKGASLVVSISANSKKIQSDYNTKKTRYNHQQAM